MHLCVSLTVLDTSKCGITSVDFRLLLDKLTQFKSSSPGLCTKLGAWYHMNNTIDDSGVIALIDHLPSLFPNLGCGFSLSGIALLRNPVSKEVGIRLKEDFKRRHKLRWYLKQFVVYDMLWCCFLSCILCTSLDHTASLLLTNSRITKVSCENYQFQKWDLSMFVPLTYLVTVVWTCHLDSWTTFLSSNLATLFCSSFCSDDQCFFFFEFLIFFTVCFCDGDKVSNYGLPPTCAWPLWALYSELLNRPCSVTFQKSVKILSV